MHKNLVEFLRKAPSRLSTYTLHLELHYFTSHFVQNYKYKVGVQRMHVIWYLNWFECLVMVEESRCMQVGSDTTDIRK